MAKTLAEIDRRPYRPEIKQKMFLAEMYNLPVTPDGTIQLESTQLAVALEFARAKFLQLNSHCDKFWPLAHCAYQRCRDGQSDRLPRSLDDLIDRAAYPADLPVARTSDIIKWVSKAPILKNNDLWQFCLRLYPPALPTGIRPPCSLLRVDEWEEFNRARREIAFIYAGMGEFLQLHEFKASQIPGLFSNIDLLKFSAYLSMATANRSQNKGPDKFGMYFLYNFIMAERSTDG
jgi:hypothetical protein